MSYYEQNTVAVYERKFELDFLCKIYQEGRLHFPHSEQLYDNSITAAGLIRAIQIGIPMPVIYASELQNGDFLILEYIKYPDKIIAFVKSYFIIRRIF